MWAVSTVTMLVLAGILPDFQLQSPDGDSATTIAVTAALGAGAFGVLSAVVWPLLVRLLLLVPALVLGLLVFFLNGSLLLLALRLNPSGRPEAAPETAVIVAAVMSAVASATGAALAVRDDDAYRSRLHRLALRRGRSLPPCSTTPGTAVVQLDGVGHDVLRDAVDQGLMPTVARWLGTGPDRAASPDRATAPPTHRLTPWRTDWSSQTGASQLGILHGTNHDVPAFRWYEKDTGEVMVCNRPTSAVELQRRAVARTGHGGLLADDGASRGNLFSGGAGESALVLSVSARRGPGTRSRAGYFAYFSDPANAVRTALSFIAETGREIGQSLCARLRKQRPRVSRGGLYPLIRAFADRRRTRRRRRRRRGRPAGRPLRRLRRPGRLRRGGPPLRTAQPGRREGAAPPGPRPRPDREGRRARPAPVPDRRPVRPRAEPRRDLPRPLRPHPRRPGPGRLRTARAAPRPADPQRRRGAGRRPGRAAPPGGGGRRAPPPRPPPRAGRAGLRQPRPGLVPGRAAPDERGGDRRPAPRAAAHPRQPPRHRLPARTQRGARRRGARRPRRAHPARRPRRRPRAARRVRPRRGRRRPPHPLLPAHRRHHGQLQPRPGRRRGAGLRGADRLARRPRRRAVPPLPAVPAAVLPARPRRHGTRRRRGDPPRPAPLADRGGRTPTGPGPGRTGDGSGDAGSGHAASGDTCDGDIGDGREDGHGDGRGDGGAGRLTAPGPHRPPIPDQSARTLPKRPRRRPVHRVRAPRM
ncbi:membrane protein [Streptomyces sp. e14]|nr:membrane protein [Streptomyces sp. e14]